MTRGKEDKIIIVRDEESKKIKITIEGFWTGKERIIIKRTLPKELRRHAHRYIQNQKRATQVEKKQQEKSELEQKRLAGLKAYWAAKKEKKLKEEEKKNVRGQRKQKSK